MVTSDDGRGRQIARNLTIAVASAALAGSAAAMAADSGGTPSPTKRAAGAADCVKPGPAKGDRGPLAGDDAIVKEARARFQALVAAGTLEQGEADAVLREVIAGSINLDELVRDGAIAAPHAPTIDAVLKELKHGHDDEKPAPAAEAAKRAKAARSF